MPSALPAATELPVEPAAGSISAVLPTRNRAAALRVTLPAMLALRDLTEIVVVVHGSTDATLRLLDQVVDPRLRIVTLATGGGPAAARNQGAAQSSGYWVLFLEDDCGFPPDYGSILRREAATHLAAVAGAPMVHPRRGQSLSDAVAEARAAAEGDGGLDGVTRFPRQPTVTPLLQAPVLVRRDLVLRYGFDEGFRGSGYREETDFFLRVTQARHRCLLTPQTWFWEVGRWPGGASSSSVLAEWQTWRNNWRFLRRHERWLRENRLVSSAAAEQVAFVGRRAHRLLSR